MHEDEIHLHKHHIFQLVKKTYLLESVSNYKCPCNIYPFHWYCNTQTFRSVMRFTISHTFHILFLFLHFFVTQLTCLECRYCSSVDENSDCRDGSVETTRLCTIKGEDHCYEEYIINNVKRDGDYVPLYRRGCAPPDWCLIQQNNHGGALKYCRVCQGDKCNDRRFGAVNCE